MLKECRFSRSPVCGLRSNWCKDQATSTCFDSPNFLQQGRNCREHGATVIATGTGSGGADDGADPSLPSASLLVDGLALERGSCGAKSDESRPGMANSTDFSPVALGQSGFWPLPDDCREYSAQGMAFSSQSMGLAGKENGCSFMDTRKLGGEGPVIKPCNGDLKLKRPLQDRPEAPFRKRIHVCESDVDAAEERHKEDNAQTGKPIFTGLGGNFGPEAEALSAEHVEGGAGDDIVGLAAENPSVGVQLLDGNGGGHTDGNLGEQDVDTPLEAIDVSTEYQDTVGTSVPIQEETSFKETELTDEELGFMGVFEGNDRNCVKPLHHAQCSTAQLDDLGGQQPQDRVNDGEGSKSGTDAAEREEQGDVNLFSQNEEGRKNPVTDVRRDNVVIIEVDDSDDEPIELNDFESDGSSTKGTKPITRPSQQRCGFRYTTSRSTSASYSPDEESDSDDCQVVGEWKPKKKAAWFQRPDERHHVMVEEDEDSDSEESMSEESDSSDVEVVGTSQGEIRRMWEEAAMRRRMGRAMQSEGSKANGEHEGADNLGHEDRAESQGLAESVATSTYRGSPDSKAETSEVRGGDEAFVNANDGQLRVNSVFGGEDGLDEKSLRNDGIVFSRVDIDNTDTFALRVDCENEMGTTSSGMNGCGNKGEHGSINPEDPGTSFVNEVRGKNDPISTVVEHTAGGSTSEDLLAMREILKQTPEFRQADKEEWDSRHQELQRQQRETQKLRQRKRVEADRKQEMERKQKQRIQELRQSQLKEERNMDIREQIRGQVRAVLEQSASTCNDFATLLRRFGIPVEGGAQPTEQQVNAAYKRALFKFHPDRAATTTEGDLRRQVEAEEKFKLISRLKKTLTPVAIGYFHPFR